MWIAIGSMVLAVLVLVLLAVGAIVAPKPIPRQSAQGDDAVDQHDRPVDLNDVYARAQRSAPAPHETVIREAVRDALSNRPRVGIGSIAVGVFIGLCLWSLAMWGLSQINNP